MLHIFALIYSSFTDILRYITTLHHSKRDMNAPFTGLAIQKKRTNLSPDDVATYYNVTIEQHDNDTVASLKYNT